MKIGNSSIYQVRGTRGHQWLHAVSSGLDAKSAREMARDMNERVADRLGITARQYRAENQGTEGWFTSGRDGQERAS